MYGHMARLLLPCCCSLPRPPPCRPAAPTLSTHLAAGGQKRRVSVAISLVKGPGVIFLDEPTSGLDSEMAAQIIDTLVALSRKMRTVCPVKRRLGGKGGVVRYSERQGGHSGD